jgi:chromosomal replication initiator protein
LTTPPAFWQRCLDAFSAELTPQQFGTWIRPLVLEDTGQGFRLLAPNRFVLQWVKERFAARIAEVAEATEGRPVDIVLGVAAPGSRPPTPGPAAPPPADAGAQSPAPRERPAAVAVAASRRHESTSLNPEFSFANFVSGKANQLARAAAMQVAGAPTSYNPLFVYGGVGLGKTHLIQAIGNDILARDPKAKIRYVHAESYVSDVVRAYQHKSFDDFKRYYRSLDLLLIDDIQFFNGKSRTQEEFFYLFNTLLEGHKQVVITCDTYPKEIAGMEERLISRFGWGLTVAIEPPELEMRVAIVLKKAEAEAAPVSEEIAFFIAKNIRSNVRELEGALKKVLAYSRFTGREMSLDLAKEALRDILNVASRQISVDGIQKTVAEYFKLKISDMHSKKRSRNVARPRQVAMSLAKELTPMSLPEIGEAFGNRDHTTVLHACRTISTLRKKDSALNRDYLVLEQVLKG